MQDITKGFQNVSQTIQPNFFFEFLDQADSIPGVQAYQKLMRELLQVQPGQRALDVGCGIGHEAMRLAELVGPQGRVVGIDKSDAMIGEAQRRAAQTQLPLDLFVGDAHRLDLPDASFDASRADRVFMYLADPEQAFQELVRVTKPGGRIAIFDFDNDGMLLATPDARLRSITRRLVAFNSDSLPSGTIGTQLPRMFRQAGLQEIRIESYRTPAPFWLIRKAFGGAYDSAAAAGVVSAEDLAEWWAYQERAEASGEFTAFYAGFIVSGRKA